MKIYTDDRLLSVGLIGGTLSRHTGNMCDLNAQNEIYKQLDVPPQKIAHFHQIHSDRIITISNTREISQFQQEPLQEADGWLVKTGGCGVAILTADCVPLFLWDKNGHAFALSHCGWKGVVKKLPFLTAKALLNAGAQHIQGWLGPHIQSCCFEVQQDVADQFSKRSIVHKNGKIFVNLNTEILGQLQEAGVDLTQIKTPYYCTCGDKENFFSWRRDHVRQNLLSFIYKP